MPIIWKNEYNLATVAILLVFAIIYFRRTRLPGITSRLFELMIGDLFIATLCETLGAEYDFHFAVKAAWPVYLLDCIYMILMMALCGMFSIFVYLLARKGKYTEGRWYWYVGYMPLLIPIGLILSTPWTGYVFFYDGYNFEFRTGTYLVYLVGLAYIVLAGVFGFRYRKAIDSRDRNTVVGFLIGIFISCIYEYSHENVLIVNFAAALCLILVYFSRSYNTNRLDALASLYNRDTFEQYITELQNHETPFSILAFSPQNFSEFIHTYGNFAGDAVIGTVGSKLLDNYGSMNSYYLGGGAFVIVGTQETYEHNLTFIERVFADEFVGLGNSYRLDFCGCHLDYPNNLGSGSMMNFIEKGLDIAIKSGDRIIVSEENFSEIRDSVVLRLEREQEELEKKRLEAEEARLIAEQATRSKSTFLAQMSHEIRTPLTTIMGMTEILLRGNLAPSARNQCESIYNSGKSLLQIINDILDFSKIEAGKFSIVEEPYNLASTLDNVISAVKIRVGSKPIRLMADIDPKIPAVLKGDEGRIKQIMANFLSNAAKYTDVGSITINVGWDTETSELLFDVTDTGRGIKEEDMDKLFGSFNRLDARNNKAIEGTGLGLAITKSIVEIMGGTVHVESTYGAGSTFGFRLHQNVIKDIPLACVDDSEGKYVVMYVSEKEQAQHIKSIIDSIDVRCDIVDTIEPLHGDMGNTHVLLDTTTYQEYKNDAKIFGKDTRNVILLPWEEDIDEQADNRYVAIHYPVCSVSIANAFVNEVAQSKFRGSAMSSFIAPEAQILLVDDIEFNRTIARELMAPHKLLIDEAESGRECIEHIKRKRYDLVMLDHMMPGMDGIETLAQIVKLDVYKDNPMPIIAFTANAVSGMKEEFKTAGFSDFISKPISVDRLESILTTYLPQEKILMMTKEAFDAMTRKDRNAVSNEYDPGSIYIKGTDVVAGLANIGNNVEKYMKVLKVICSEYENSTGRIKKALEENDIKNYTIEVHALKSTMASIGAMDLSLKAKELEMAGKASDVDYIRESNAATMTEYGIIVDSIREAVKDYDEYMEAHKSVDVENLRGEFAQLLPDFADCLTSLRLLIDECEYEAAMKLAGLYSELLIEDDNRENMKRITEKFEIYDYDGAETIINELN